MCKAPKAPQPKEPKKPMFLRNKYLDAYVGDSQAVNTLRTGRSSLRIPLSGAPAGGGTNPGISPVVPNDRGVNPGPGIRPRPDGIGPRVRYRGNRPNIHLR